MNIENKIEKLLRLANGTSNEHEAAAALAQAQALMERYGIEQVLVSEEGLDALGEMGDHEAFASGRVPTWLRSLALHLARANGLQLWKQRCPDTHNRFAYMVSGRARDRQSFATMFAVMRLEVDRLTREHGYGRGKRYAQSFRYGCVEAIADAIKAEREEMERSLRDQYAGTSALVKLDGAIDRLRDAKRWAFSEHGLRTSRSSGSFTYDPQGRAAGQQHGQGIYRSRQAALAGGPRRLGSGS